MRSFLRQTSLDIRTGFRQLSAFHLAVAVYSLLTAALVVRYGETSDFAHSRYMLQMAPIYLATLPLVSVAILAVRLMHRTNGWQARWAVIRTEVTPAALARVVNGLLITFSFVLFMGSFTTFKCLMPALRGGYRQDVVQADIDRLLHFGQDPGPVLVGLFPFETLKLIIEWNYSVLWALIGFIPLFFVATMKAADGIRLRYFITMIATWTLLGSVLAVTFLSAGPAFYGAVTGDTLRFSAVTEFLRQGRQGPESAALFQAYLWHHFEQGTAAIGSGISAFPSVHVGLAMMNALFLQEWDRRAGLLGFAYVGLVTVSSVYLGWHYAIDGYASIIVTLVLHRAIRRIFEGAGSKAGGGARALPPRAEAAGITPAAPPTS